MDLKPINGCVLVELTGDLQFVEMPDKQYATNTSGIVLKLPSSGIELAVNDLVGKRVYFEGFKDVEVTKDDKKYAFIKFEDIRGYESVEA